MTGLIIAGGALLFLAAAWLLAAEYLYKRTFYSDRSRRMNHYRGIEDGRRFPHAGRARELIDGMLALRTERVEITSHDGLTLVGHYLHVCDGAPLEILFHGFRSSWQRDFSGLTPHAVALGHNLLFVDQRAHGESGGRVISFGINERRDARAWADYATRRFGDGVKILLVGVSMGGATVLSALDTDLPESVRAIVADSPFSSARDVIVKVGCGNNRALTPIISALARTAARLHGFSLGESTAERAVSTAQIPVLVVHGTEDALVPAYMAERIAAASPRVRLELFDGADHVGAYFADTERYKAIFSEFLEESEI